ncbi:MAG TPA: lipopolysaccharide assembly protein LapA domain-containing protein [Alphaproteobacteria bacterium]|nr:lipopolysaccharide assembly protein LapA domain-containing protein [Alphaproteobacteria bacterium]
MKLIGWILGALVAIVLILFAVSNRGAVALQIWPLPFSLELPLYAALLAALVIGFIAGGLGGWLGGFKWRRRARRAESEAAALRRQLAELRATAAAPPRDTPALPLMPGAD